MSFRQAFSDPDSRFRLINLTVALTIFLVLPSPGAESGMREVVLLGLIWTGSMFYAYTLWGAPAYSNVLWFVSFVVMFLNWVLYRGYESTVVLLLWVVILLFIRRPKSLSSEDNKTTNTLNVSPWLVGLLVLGCGWGAQVFAQPTVSARSLAQIQSCSASFDQVIWDPRPDGRHARLLFVDYFILGNETKPSLWEFSQVLNPQQIVTYIFRRQTGPQFTESILAKDTQYTRVMDTRTGRKILQRGDLAGFVNRPYFVFRHQDGSLVQYRPAYEGKSTLTIQRSRMGGLGLDDPIYLQGINCLRPENNENVEQMKPLEFERTRAK